MQQQKTEEHRRGEYSAWQLHSISAPWEQTVTCEHWPSAGHSAADSGGLSGQAGLPVYIYIYVAGQHSASGKNINLQLEYQSKIVMEINYTSSSRNINDIAGVPCVIPQL